MCFGLGSKWLAGNPAGRSSDSDFPGQVVRGAFDEEIKEIGETQAGEHRCKPTKKIAEIRNRKSPIKSHPRRVNEIERVAPRTCAS